MKKILLSTIVFCAILLFMDSCKKDKNQNKAKTTSCTSTVYGYSGRASKAGYSTCSFGVINTSSHAFTNIDTFSGITYTNQVTYDTSDHCCYFFKDGRGSYTLYKMSLSGTLTAYKNMSSKFVRYDGIIYNTATNKLYALGMHMDAVQATVVELVFNGDWFYPIALATTVGINYSLFPINTTIDNSTGTIYYALSVYTNQYSIEKYTPGDSSATVITSGSNAGILGLQFNRNDSMLYAMTVGASPHEFIKIDPATGTLTSQSVPGISIYHDFYSTAIDACSNRYIITSMVDSTSCTYSQFSMTGVLLEHDTVANVYQGLQVLY